MLGFGLMAMVPAYFALQLVLLMRLSRGWRIAAALPLVVMVPVVVVSISDFLLGSNLWPIFIILLAPPAFLYLLVIAGLERREKRAAEEQTSLSIR